MTSRTGEPGGSPLISTDASPVELPLPQAGEAFVQFGTRLIVIEVDEAAGTLRYVSRNGRYTSPLRSSTIHAFVGAIADGLLERATDA